MISFQQGRGSFDRANHIETFQTKEEKYMYELTFPRGHDACPGACFHRVYQGFVVDFCQCQSRVHVTLLFKFKTKIKIKMTCVICRFNVFFGGLYKNTFCFYV